MRVLDYAISGAHIAVDAAVICCIEPRFWNILPGRDTSTINAFVKSQNWNFVPITEAGGIKVLASADPADAAEKQSLLFRIKQELWLHHPKILAPTVHQDCGGYGYSKTFGSITEERDRLVSDLRKAKRVLEPEIGSQVEIQLFIFDFNGVEKVKA